MSATNGQQVQDMDQADETTEAQPDSATYFEKRVGFSEAVRMTGRNKSTISRDTSTGKLPYELGDNNQKLYKIADLFQKYGLQQPKEISSREAKQPFGKADETAVELLLLRQQLHSQAEQLRRAEDDIRDLRQHRDRLTDQNQRLTLLLTGPTTPAIMPAEPQAGAAPPAPKSLWQRMLNR